MADVECTRDASVNSGPVVTETRESPHQGRSVRFLKKISEAHVSPRLERGTRDPGCGFRVAGSKGLDSRSANGSACGWSPVASSSILMWRNPRLPLEGWKWSRDSLSLRGLAFLFTA